VMAAKWFVKNMQTFSLWIGNISHFKSDMMTDVTKILGSCHHGLSQWVWKMLEGGTPS
jgi:hypothetical protein